MSRLSREKKREQREQKGAGRPAAVALPLDVHVRASGSPATIGGVPVTVSDGTEIQHAVLGHLHRIALATGHPVLARVHDERIGYVVPLRVDPDGSSHFTAEPLRTPPPQPDRSQNASAPEPHSDRPTHVLRQLQDSPPEQPPAPAQEPGSLPGTAVAPMGVFGPPPAMNRHPDPETTHETAPATDPESARTSAPEPEAPRPLPTRQTPAASKPLVPAHPTSHLEHDPDPKPTPARGFDAVAEAVLGDDPRTLPGEGGAPALLGEPVARINEAVRAGRIDAAAGLAEQTVLEASATLGPEHPEVLRLRELSAYIAYLAGDPLRAFHVSLDLARICRRARDGEAAYGNVQSAASAWRAVRDPLQGLNLGTELLGLWTELATEDGPAADDVEELESARARMVRLAERARDAGR
ncbi:tetratricopeptide repeat protein [Streptomyces sp. NPDC002588]|uniref:tetratricopeptide repeat protein n=1 Tax=Streptomyces sp. NPDC002588 TaxID=3154419 RepID=UPI003325DDB4